MGKTSEAQKKAVAKYESTKVESIRFVVKKGTREIIKRCANKNNETVNAMLYRLVEEEIKKTLGESDYLKFKNKKQK